METIRNRNNEHMSNVLENVPEAARESLQRAITDMEQRQQATPQGKPDNKSNSTEDVGKIGQDLGAGSGKEPNSQDDVQKAKGKLDLQVSDAPADIGDFTSLKVTFSMARIFTADGFEERELELPTVDLTELTDHPESVLVTDLEAGKYNKIELHIDKVVGLIPASDDYTNEEQEYINEEVPDGTMLADVKVPSNKLQIVKPFEVVEGKTTEFVFDINVVKKGQGNSYNLLPVIGKSGAKTKED